MRTSWIALLALAGLGVGLRSPRAGVQDARTEPAFHGIAIDGLSGLPIPRAHVLVPVERQTFRPYAVAEHELEAEAWSDDQGRFLLEGAGERRPTFAYLVAEGHGPVGFLAGEGHSAPESAQPIELLPRAGIEISVRDAAGAPVVGHPVGVSFPSEELVVAGVLGGRNHGVAWSGTTDATGNALFPDLPAEVALLWRVRVDNDARDPAHWRPLPILGEGLALAPGELRRVEAVLGSGARLVGQVTDERGAAVPGLELFLRARHWGTRELEEGARRSTSDERGFFEFADLPFRAFELGPASRGGVFVGNRSLLVDRPRIELDLTVTSGLAIEGRIVASVAELGRLDQVRAEPLDGGLGAGAELEPDGRFRIAPLAPGEYRICAKGIKLRTEARRARAGESDVELTLAGERRVPVILEGVDREKITFSVYDRAGETGSQSEERGPRFEQMFRAGRHDLKAWTEDGRVGFLSDVAIDAEGPAELRLVLVPCARVTFVHRAPSGTRTLRLAVAGGSFPPDMDMMDGFVLLAGEACTLLVPAGEVTAELLEGERVAARAQVVLLPRERRRVVLEPR